MPTLPSWYTVPSATDFASWVQAALESQGMSQRELAAMTGVDHSTVSRLVAGVREPLLSTATRIVHVLELCDCGEPRRAGVHQERCDPPCDDPYRHHSFYKR